VFARTVFCDQLVLERDGTWASKGEAPPAAEVLYDDWRLPNVRELSSVVDFGEHDPAFSTVFDGPAAPYWTSTSVVAAPEQGWVVDFVDGYRFAASKELKLSVRAVRDAK
jgi:hypothetical protein